MKALLVILIASGFLSYWIIMALASAFTPIVKAFAGV